jgi:predicted O-methyltransferase YrrM
MEEQDGRRLPAVLGEILRETEASGFRLASDPQTGLLLRALAASKPGGSLLELGTGTGVGTCWLLDGMDARARLVTVDRDTANTAIARRHLGDDGRLTFVTADAAEFLRTLEAGAYDLIFADTSAGKFQLLERALDGLAVGGFYVVDDLLPSPRWGEGQGERVAALVAALEDHPGLHVVRLDWSSGLLVAVRRSPRE